MVLFPFWRFSTPFVKGEPRSSPVLVFLQRLIPYLCRVSVKWRRIRGLDLDRNQGRTRPTAQRGSGPYLERGMYSERAREADNTSTENQPIRSYGFPQSDFPPHD